jgi:hypothetical protein
MVASRRKTARETRNTRETRAGPHWNCLEKENPPRRVRRDGSDLTDQEMPNFISLIAAKSVTSPPTRLVA